MDLGKKQLTAFSPPRAGGLLGTKKAPDLSAPKEAFSRNHRHLEHLTWLRRAGRAFLGCSHEHRRQQSAEAALGCLSAVLDLSQRPRTGTFSAGSSVGLGCRVPALLCREAPSQNGRLLPRCELWKPAQASKRKVRLCSGLCLAGGNNILWPAIHRNFQQNEDSIAPGHHKGPQAVNKLTKPKPPQGGIFQRRHWKLCWKTCQILRQQSVGSQSCCFSSAGSHPSFDPLGLAVCVRC